MSQEKIFYEKAMRWLNFIMKYTGLHLMSDNNDKRFMKRLRQRWFFCFVFVWFNTDFAGEFAWFVINARAGKSVSELSYAAPCISMCFLANIKVYYFLKHELLVNDLISSLQRLQSINSGKVRKEVEKEQIISINSLIKVFKIQYWLSIAALGGFAILPFVIMALSYSETGKVELMLPYQVIYFFDATEKHVWPFMYLRQLWTSSIIVFIVLGVDCFYYTCCTYIEVQFRNLYYNLQNIVFDVQLRDTNKFVEDLAAFVKIHQELFRCVRLLEQVYSKSTLFNVVSSSMLICLIVFNITVMESWPRMMPFFAFVFMATGQIFVLCYFGDLVARASTAISNAAFYSEWYNLNVKERKDILFILQRAQTPCKLTASGFSDINLVTFARILSTAWSYFALLSTMMTTSTTIDDA